MSNLIEVSATPPMLAAWVTEDQSIRFVITKVSLPHNVTLIQESVEEGFLKAMNGTLVESKTYKVAGHTVFGMSARGSLTGNKITAIQSVVAVGDQVYTVAVMGIGNDILANYDAKEFIDSLRILQGNIDGSEVGATTAIRMREKPKTFVVVIDAGLAILCGLDLLFIAYGSIVLVKRWWRRREPAQQKNVWVNLYIIVAAICGYGRVAGCWENIKFVLRGTGLPAEPVARQAFIVGMFVAPAILFLLTLVFVLLGRRKSRRMVTTILSLTRASESARQSATDPKDDQP